LPTASNGYKYYGSVGSLGLSGYLGIGIFPPVNCCLLWIMQMKVCPSQLLAKLNFSVVLVSSLRSVGKELVQSRRVFFG